MKKNIKYILGVFIVLLLTITSCTQETYSLGDLSAPSNLVINAVIVGQDASHPNGDGSGNVNFSITGDNILATSIDYDASDAVNLVFLPTGTVTKKFDTHLGVNIYRVTVVASGKGGSQSTITKDITIRYDYTPDPAIVTNLTNNTSKTWIVDKSVAGHFGVGPWDPTSVTPSWWAAAINEKVATANCFYTATFTFTKVVASGTYSLTVASPDGAFTKTGSLAGGLPGIPSSGDEGCYAYAGGTSAFTFGGSTSGVVASAPSTQTNINLAGTNTFIGYGATLKGYEILTLTANTMYLRVQGTETGNAWYIKMIPAP
ncbi:hypothetical protein [Flavobacterium sp.]|uniref:hypothetical protein n=1 Tax=Flavobacterium sp. TaxID=239 RepID=UPI00379F19C9